MAKGLGAAWVSLLCFAGLKLGLHFPFCEKWRETTLSHPRLEDIPLPVCVCVPACARVRVCVNLCVSAGVSQWDPLSQVLILSRHKSGNRGTEAELAQTPTAALSGRRSLELGLCLSEVRDHPAPTETVSVKWTLCACL